MDKEKTNQDMRDIAKMFGNRENINKFLTTLFKPGSFNADGKYTPSFIESASMGSKAKERTPEQIGLEALVYSEAQTIVMAFFAAVASHYDEPKEKKASTRKQLAEGAK